MAGGTWTVQNKVRPGAYINFTGTNKNATTASDRGVVTIPLTLNWGETKNFIEVDSKTDFKKILGYDILDSKLILIKEALKRASKSLIYRVNSGTKATKIADTLTITAKYEGTRGNDITVKITANPDIKDSFVITTYLSGEEVDEQLAKNIEELKTNDYVEFKGTGVLVASAGIALETATDTNASSGDYTEYFNALEIQEFNVIALPIEDATIKGAAVNFVRRMRETEGKKIQVILPDYARADYEGVISVKNGVILSDGTTIDKIKATAWIAGATAGANINQSNTYTAYDDATDTDTKYTNTQIIEALNKGEFIFVPKQGRAVIEQDINTLTTLTQTKGKEFRKNRVIRVLDEIGNTISKTFEKSYIGKMDNNENGRTLFKSDIIYYFNTLQNINAIQNFNSNTDIEVIKGQEVDSVIANVGIQPVDSMEKLYMTVNLK